MAGIIILLCSILGFVFCIVAMSLWGDWEWAEPFWLCLLMIVLGAVVFVQFVALPISRIETKQEIEQYYVTLQTIERARENEGIENYAMQQEVIKLNKWVKRVQFYRERFAIYFPKEVEELEYVE